MKRIVCLLFLLFLSFSFARTTVYITFNAFNGSMAHTPEAGVSSDSEINCSYSKFVKTADGTEILVCSKEDIVCPKNVRVTGDTSVYSVEYKEEGSIRTEDITVLDVSEYECINEELDASKFESKKEDQLDPIVLAYRFFVTGILLALSFVFAYFWSFKLKKRLLHLGLIALFLWIMMKITGIGGVCWEFAAFHISLLGLMVSCVIIHIYRRTKK